MPAAKKPKGAKDRKFVPYVKGFHPPNATQKRNALGGTAAPEFDDSEKFFEPIPKCTSIDDWLAQYDEDAQSYSDYLMQNPWLSNRKITGWKNTFQAKGRSLSEKYPDGKIYILPLGLFDSDSSPKFDALIDYARSFFCLRVERLPTIELEHTGKDTYWMDDRTGENCSERKLRLGSRFDQKSGRRQLKVVDILAALRTRLPDDAFCLIALTMCDLYEEKSDLFLAGMAAGRHRVAVFSLLRYDPNLNFSKEFWHQIQRTKLYSAEERARLLLLRSCRLLVHETSHLLGIGHCVYYSCCMNGSGHLEEDFKQPMYLCPIDLRKLQTLCGFNVLHRYRGLLDFFRAHGMADEADWTDRRIQFIQDKGKTQ